MKEKPHYVRMVFDPAYRTRYFNNYFSFELPRIHRDGLRKFGEMIRKVHERDGPEAESLQPLMKMYLLLRPDVTRTDPPEADVDAVLEDITNIFS